MRQPRVLRDDITLKPLAESLGYTVDTKGDTFDSDNNILTCCGHGYCFRKNNKVVWGIRDGYTCADLIDNRYCNHRKYPDLKTALEQEA